MKMVKFNNWIYLVIYRKSPDDMPDMVFSSTFWFHINASVVKCPSAAIFICSRVQVIFSASRFTSYQLSSYQPVQKRKMNVFHRHTNKETQMRKINKSEKKLYSVYDWRERKTTTTKTKGFGEQRKKNSFHQPLQK